VLVNSYAASASEIFAAAIQDYGRGIIMGTHATFGKGTVQNVIDFDRVTGNGLNDMKPLGAIKITTEKFYRINGGTTQLQGVVPDIIWPDALQYLKTGEKEYDNALAVDQIPAADFTKWPLDPDKKAKAIANSHARIAANEKMMKIGDYARWLKDEDKEKQIPLRYTDFRAMQDSNEEITKKYKNLNRSEDSLAVGPLPHQLTLFANDEGKKTDYQRWFKGLAWDLQLREAVYVVKDIK
jgi:carboxyl-terminal processing protease